VSVHAVNLSLVGPPDRAANIQRRCDGPTSVPPAPSLLDLEERSDFKTTRNLSGENSGKGLDIVRWLSAAYQLTGRSSNVRVAPAISAPALACGRVIVP